MNRSPGARRTIAALVVAACLIGIAVKLAIPSAAGQARRALAARGIDVSGSELLARAERGDAPTVRLLLQAAVDRDTRDPWKRTPLHLATRGGHLEVVSLLLQSGCTVDARDLQGRTPVHLAAGGSAPAVLDALVAAGGDVNARDEFGVTPLHRACLQHAQTQVDLLLRHGADVSATTTEGETPLHLALLVGDGGATKSLLAAGADINARRLDGTSCLGMAVIGKHRRTVSLALSAGARVDVPNSDGSTPLHRAVFSGNGEIVRALLEAGADPRVTDHDGRTPLHRLYANPGAAVIDALLKAGAPLNAVDHWGRTPLDVVVALGDVEMAALLHERGAHTGHKRDTAAPAPSKTAATDPPRPPAVASSPRGALLEGYRESLQRVLAQGRLPIIDVHFHYNVLSSLEDITSEMDDNGVALAWISPTPSVGHETALRLSAAFPRRFVPLTISSQGPPWMSNDPAFLALLNGAVDSGRYFALGEVECRHYATLQSDRDVYTPMDSPQMNALLALSARSGLPLLLHHESEDAMLPELERALTAWPDARVIWSHFGRNRCYTASSRIASASFVRGLLERHANLYFDVATRTEASAMLEQNGSLVTLNPAFKEMIVAFPDRFMIGSDSNSFRLVRFDAQMANTRDSVFPSLPPEVASRLAFKNAWRLMSGQEWRD